MKKTFSKIISVAFFAAFLPNLVHAAVLEDTYFINSTHTEVVSGNIGLVNIVGEVSGLPGYTPGLSTPLQFKHKKWGTSTWIGDLAFSPNSSGIFSYTNDDLECSATYDFKLYDNTSSTAISLDFNDNIYSAAGIFVNCLQTSSGNVYTPGSAGAEEIQGVNWGSITATDTSISINNARLIPFISNGAKNFKIEWGFGEPGQPSYTALLESPDPPYSESPNYVFSRQINGLLPATDYFINLREITDVGTPDEVSTNLFVYGFKTTGPVSSNNTNWEATDTELHVSGRLVTSTGNPVANRSILIEITSADLDLAPNPTPGSFATTTTPIIPGGSLSSAGAFDHTFNGLVPGGQYFISIKDSFSGNNLINPIEITMAATPEEPLGGTGDDPGSLADQPEYLGLVPCGDTIDDECEFNDLLTLVNRVVNFLIFYIGFPFVAIILAWAGIKLLTSGGSNEAKSQAKSMISKVILGLILALLCWAIIKLVLLTLGYCGPLFPIFDIAPPAGCTVTI